eukprot:17319-Eustigmatos_ZCMA.PRE.1
MHGRSFCIAPTAAATCKWCRLTAWCGRGSICVSREGRQQRVVRNPWWREGAGGRGGGGGSRHGQRVFGVQ